MRFPTPWGWRPPTVSAPHDASNDSPAFRQSLTTASASQDCRSCHAVDDTLSHPVDVTPTMPVPADLPLTNGRVTCTTCHAPADESTHGLIPAPQAGQLRGGSTPAALCARCHRDAAGHNASHARRLNQAHLWWPDRSPVPGSAQGFPVAATADRHGFAGGLDALSRNCMQCHDGTQGADIGRSHPMGVPYTNNPTPSPITSGSARRATSGGARRLVPASQLDPRVRLLENQVGCASCHAPFDTERKLLVMPNHHDRLCLSCHAMR